MSHLRDIPADQLLLSRDCWILLPHGAAAPVALLPHCPIAGVRALAVWCEFGYLAFQC